MMHKIMRQNARSFSTFSLHSNKKNASQRIGKVKRNFFGFVIIVPEQYAMMLHRFRKFHR